MKVPADLRYTKEHEWVRIEETSATVGITDFAQDALGDIVYLELPKVGADLAAGVEITEIESTKTTSAVYAPIAGKITAINEILKERPELINKEPYGDGWIAVIEMSQPKAFEKLMTATEYEAFLQKEAH